MHVGCPFTEVRLEGRRTVPDRRMPCARPLYAGDNDAAFFAAVARRGVLNRRQFLELVTPDAVPIETLRAIAVD